MARRRRSTRKGMRRRTSRKAYYPKRGGPRRTRRFRSRRGRISVRRRRGGAGMMKAGTRSAVTDIGYMCAGAAASAVIDRYASDMMPFNSADWTTAGLLGGWGLYKGDKKLIYAGFGAIMHKVQPQISRLLQPKTT